MSESYEEWKKVHAAGLSYPETFHDLMAVVARWGHARQATPPPGYSIVEWLTESADELGRTQEILRQVWERSKGTGA